MNNQCRIDASTNWTICVNFSKLSKVGLNIAPEATFGQWFCDCLPFGAMPKHHVFFGTSLEAQKVEKLGQDAAKGEPWGQRLELGWWTFRSRGPQGAAPSTRTRQKKEGDGRKKEEPRKKESGKWKKVQEGSEHASGQRPCEFINNLWKHYAKILKSHNIYNEFTLYTDKK